MKWFRVRRGLAAGVHKPMLAGGSGLPKRTMLLVSLIAGLLVLLPASAFASNPPQPTYGTATVDGNAGEWNLTNDFFQHMYVAGDPSKANLSDAYLRYDCSTHTLYVLVLQVSPGQILAQPANAWATINGAPQKVYTGSSGNDGTPPDFAWVGLNGGFAQGYEASFSIAPGTYTIVVHVEANDGSGTAQTSAFPGFNSNFGSPTQLVLDCSSPHPSYSIQKQQKIDGSGGAYTTSTLTGQVGQKVLYQMTVTNTGNTSLTFSNFTDAHCDAGTISGGPGSGSVAAGSSTTWTCSHLLTTADQTAGSYSNNATVTGTPPNGQGSAITQTSNTVVVTVPAADHHPGFSITKLQRDVPGGGTTTPNPNDQLTVEKQEGFIGQLNAGETRTTTIACPGGYQVLDGSAIIQNVDQGTGTQAAVQVLQSESTSTGSYTFTVHNPNSGQAEVQGFVTCVLNHTTDGGAITVTDSPVTQTVSFGAGTTIQTLACPAGYIAVDPGWNFTSGAGIVTGSQPNGDGSKWTFTVSATARGSVNLSIRCLKLTTSDVDMLSTRDITQQVTVPAGQVVTAQVTCPVGYKGVTASYTLPPGLVMLGHEPQPITRVFTLDNTTDSAQTATLDLVCLLNTTVQVTPSAPPGPWTSSDIGGSVGDTIQYKITVTNTGDTQLTFGDLVDPHCDAGTIAGGPGAGGLAPGDSATYTCSHVLTAADQTAGSYSNTATVTGTPPAGQGSAITHSSNTVVVYLAGIHTVAVAPAGAGTLTRLTLNSVSQVQVNVYGPGGASAAAATTKRHAPVLYGSVVRKNAVGHLKITVKLNKAGRQWLARHHRMTVTVEVRITPRHGKARVTYKTVTLKG